MIRRARPEDTAAVVALIGELAKYERARDEVQASEESLRLALFGRRPAVFAHVAEDDGQVVGFALWFLNFSTWVCRPGIYLEDLYVRPAFRGRGHGRALLQELARICVENDYGRLEWRVLDWNTPALEFYSSIGAVPMDEWTTHRVTGHALTTLAEGRRAGDHSSRRTR
ncbi:MAG: GNAT family N-acetyltransferase [Carbonactinosporaceae bacterium]